MNDDKSTKIKEMISELLAVHNQLAKRDNLSTTVIVNMALAEKDFASSVAAALLTLGGLHAPLTKAYIVLKGGPKINIKRSLKENLLIPGWGSGFVKGSPDPMFEKIDAMLLDASPVLHKRIQSITTLFHDAGKQLYPNAACYTAAFCIFSDYPIHAAAAWLLKGRIDSWCYSYLSNYNPRML